MKKVEWIKAEDRLPPEGTLVLCAYCIGDVPNQASGMARNGKILLSANAGVTKDRGVSHWAVIPDDWNWGGRPKDDRMCLLMYENGVIDQGRFFHEYIGVDKKTKKIIHGSWSVEKPESVVAWRDYPKPPCGVEMPDGPTHEGHAFCEIGIERLCAAVVGRACDDYKTSIIHIRKQRKRGADCRDNIIKAELMNLQSLEQWFRSDEFDMYSGGQDPEKKIADLRKAFGYDEVVLCKST